MPVIRKYYVGKRGDYSDIQQAILAGLSDASNNLVTADVILEILLTEHYQDCSNGISVSTGTTGVNNYIRLSVVDDLLHEGDLTGKPHIVNLSSMYLGVSHILIEDLFIANTVADVATISLIKTENLLSAADGFTEINRVLFRGIRNKNSSGLINLCNAIGYNTFKFRTNVAVDIQLDSGITTNSLVTFTKTSGSQNVNIENNTVYNTPKTRIVTIPDYTSGQGANVFVRNNILIGKDSSTGIYVASAITGTPTFENNLVSENVANGYAPIDKYGSSENIFIDAENFDFRLRRFSSAVENATNLSKLFTTDCTGRIYTNWNCGAFSFNSYASSVHIGVGGTFIRKKLYIEDAQGKWVDFSHKLVTFPSVTKGMENSYNNYYANANTVRLINSDGFWDSPFPTDMRTLDDSLAKWNNSGFAITQLIHNGTPARIQLLEEFVNPNGDIYEKILGTFYVDNLITDSSDTQAQLVLTTGIKLLTRAKADDVKNGNFWYQGVPAWFLLDKIIKKAFGVTENGKITLPDTFIIPKTVFANAELDSTVYSILGRPPGMIDTDGDNIPDGFSIETGTPRAIAIWGNTLFIGIDNTLWSVDKSTLVYTKLISLSANVFPRSTEEISLRIINIEVSYPKLYLTCDYQFSGTAKVGSYFQGNSADIKLDNTAYWNGESTYERRFEYRVYDIVSNSSEVISSELQGDSRFFNIPMWIYLGKYQNQGNVDNAVVSNIVYNDVIKNNYTEPIIVPFKQRTAICRYVNPTFKFTYPKISVFRHEEEISLDPVTLPQSKKENLFEYTQIESTGQDPLVLDQGAYTMIFPEISQTRKIFNAFSFTFDTPQEAHTSLKYTSGQKGINRIFLTSDNTGFYYIISFDIVIKSYTKNEILSDIVGNVVDIPNTEIVIKKFDKATDSEIDTKVYKDFRSEFILEPQCATLTDGDSNLLLFVRERVYRSSALNVTPLRSPKSFLICINLQPESTDFGSTNGRTFTLSTAAENNKDTAYWGASNESSTILYTCTTTPTLADVQNCWYKIGDSDSANVVLVKNVSGNSLVAQQEGKDVSNDIPIVYAVGKFPYPYGDFRSQGLKRIGIILAEFQNYDFLDIVKLPANNGRNLYAVSFFNRKKINSNNALFGIQILDLSENASTKNFDLVTEGENYPFSIETTSTERVIYGQKLFSKPVFNLASSNEENVYFTVGAKGQTYGWSYSRGFVLLGNNQTFDTSDMFSTELALDSNSFESEVDRLPIFGITKPIVDDLFLPVSDYGKYSIWALTRKPYAVIELADFSNMTCLDAASMLVEAMFYTLGIDKFGNIQITAKTTQSEENILTLDESKYGKFSLDYNLKNVFNKVSVIPYTVKLGNLTYNINTFLRDEDQQVKLALQVKSEYNKPKNLKLICVESGYIGESEDDYELQYNFKYAILPDYNSKEIVLDYTEEDDQNFPLPEAGTLSYYVQPRERGGVTNLVNTSLSNTQKINFRYHIKSYRTINNISYVVVKSNSDRVGGIIVGTMGLVGLTHYPLFDIYSYDSPIEVSNVQTVTNSDTTIYLNSAFGGEDTEEGIKEGQFLVILNPVTNETIHREIISVNSSLNTIEINRSLNFELPLNTAFQILPQQGSIYGANNLITISSASLNTLTVIGGNVLSVGMTLKIYDTVLDTELNKRFTITQIFRDSSNDVSKIVLSSSPGITDFERSKLKYYFSPQVLGVFYSIGNTGISLRFDAEYPSYPEQRSFSEGESISVVAEGMKLENNTSFTQTVSDVRSIQKYGLQEYPAFNNNKFLSAGLAKQKALQLLSLFAFPHLKLNVIDALNYDIDFFVNNELMLIEVKHQKKFAFMPNRSEIIRIDKITDKGKFMDIEGTAINPYENSNYETGSLLTDHGKDLYDES